MEQTTEMIREYLELIRNRSEGADLLLPSDHVVDWSDRPYRSKIYENVMHIVLPDSYTESGGNEMTEASFLGKVLCALGAPLRIKRPIDWNVERLHDVRRTSHEVTRAAASGGGLYPTEIFLGIGNSYGIRRGLYYYDGNHHSLALVVPGSPVSRISSALGIGQEKQPAIYLLIAIDLWKSSFKYHDFAYHVCAQDVGAALAVARYFSIMIDSQFSAYFDFDDDDLNRLCGCTPPRESIFAVVALDHAVFTNRGREKDLDRPDTNGYSITVPVCSSRERSRRVLLPARLASLQSAGMSRAVKSIAPVTLSEHSEENRIWKSLPFHHIARRHSAWGSHRSYLPMPSEKLLFVLRSACGLSCGAPISSVSQDRGLKLILIVNHVDDVSPGVYDFSSTKGLLHRHRPDPSDHVLLQSFYTMENYNLEQVGCIIVVIAPILESLRMYGARALRIVDARVGMLAQALYLQAVQQGFECGAVLGIRIAALNQWLALTEPQETAMMAVMMGPGIPEISPLDLTFFPHV